MTEHALVRLRERYSPEMAAADIKTLRDKIIAGLALHVGNTEGGARIYVITHKGMNIRVVWHVADRALITVLPPKAQRDRRRLKVPRKGKPARAD